MSWKQSNLYFVIFTDIMLTNSIPCYENNKQENNKFSNFYWKSIDKAK